MSPDSPDEKIKVRKTVEVTRKTAAKPKIDSYPGSTFWLP